jgi:hypothetical protein
MSTSSVSIDLLWRDHNRIRRSAVVRTRTPRTPLGSTPLRSCQIVGFGCTRIDAGRQAEIYWDLRRKWPQICRNSPEPAGKTYAHTHLGHPCTTADQRIRLWPPCPRAPRGGRISGLGPRRPTTCQARFVARRGGPQQPVSSEQRPCRGLCRRGGNVECRARHRIS